MSEHQQETNRKHRLSSWLWAGLALVAMLVLFAGLGTILAVVASSLHWTPEVLTAYATVALTLATFALAWFGYSTLDDSRQLVKHTENLAASTAWQMQYLWYQEGQRNWADYLNFLRESAQLLLPIHRLVTSCTMNPSFWQDDAEFRMIRERIAVSCLVALRWRLFDPELLARWLSVDQARLGAESAWLEWRQLRDTDTHNRMGQRLTELQSKSYELVHYARSKLFGLNAGSQGASDSPATGGAIVD